MSDLVDKDGNPIRQRGPLEWEVPLDVRVSGFAGIHGDRMREDNWDESYRRQAERKSSND